MTNKIHIRILYNIFRKRQVYRCSVLFETPEAYYKQNLAIPFLYHISVEIEERFSGVFNLKGVLQTLLQVIPGIALSEDKK